MKEERTKEKEEKARRRQKKINSKKSGKCLE